jgi:hypothetical protein
VYLLNNVYSIPFCQAPLKWITPHPSVKCNGKFQPAFGIAISVLDNFTSIRREVKQNILVFILS